MDSIYFQDRIIYAASRAIKAALKVVTVTDEWRLIVSFSFLALGIGIYFSLPFEPPLLFPLVALLLGLCLKFAIPDQVVQRAGNDMAVLAFGFLCAWGQTSLLTHYDFPATQKFYALQGHVEKIERRENGPVRLYLRLSGMPASGQYSEALVRVAVRTKIKDQLYIGALIRVNGVLKAPDGPIFPGGYDFGRKAWFDGISATGFAVSDVFLIDDGRKSLKASLSLSIEKIRQQIADGLVEKMGAKQGGLAAALLVGRRDYVPKDLVDDMRDVGLSHMLAISGMHMAIVTGILYFIFETLFSLIPRLALRMTPGKLAVPFAMMGATGYLLLSGMSVSTQRAYVMVTIVLLALVLGRRAFSLHSLAIAGFIILLISPFSLLSAGFQMSFAATAGLIVFFNAYTQFQRRQWKKDRPFLQNTPFTVFRRKVASFFLMIFLTTLVAQLSVAPISLYHFNTVSVIALVANVLVMPVLTILVMPLGVLAVFLSALSIDIPLFYDVFRHVLALISGTGQALADADFGQIRTANLTGFAYAIGLAGFAALVLIRPVQLGFMVFMLALTLMMALEKAPVPDLYIMPSGKSLIAYEADQPDKGESLYFKGIRKGSFTYNLAYESIGLKPEDSYHRLPGKCGIGGCLYIFKGKQILVTDDSDVQVEECGKVDILINTSDTQVCDMGMILNLKSLKEQGTHALYFTKSDTIDIKTVREEQGTRPWVH